MWRHDRNSNNQNIPGDENISVTAYGKSTSTNNALEIAQRNLSENSEQLLERLKNIANGILGENSDYPRERIQTRRPVLADMKNVATNENNGKIDKDGGENLLLSNKWRRSSSTSPKRARKKSVDKKQSESGINLLKNLAKVTPPIANAGMNLRNRLVLKSNLIPSGQQLKEKPTSNETVSQAPPLQSTGINEKLLKPLPFFNGKRSFDDLYNNEVVYCEQYAADNWDYLFYIENRGVVPCNFLHGSKITPRNRMTAIDWITRIQINFKLLPETHLTTVHLLDRCLMARRFTLEKKEIQLISLGCAMVAAKYEEIYPPEVSEYLSSCDNTKQEIMRAEISVLHLLNFDLRYPRAIQFIRRLTEHYELSVHTLAKTISEIASYDYTTCYLKPSVIAAVSVYIAASLEEVEFPVKLHSLARVSEVETKRLAPVFASTIIELISNEKSYSAIYNRMCMQRRILFTNKHLSDLVSLVNKGH